MITAESLERTAAQPWFRVVFHGVLLLSWWFGGVDVANIFISIITAELVLFSVGAQRRSSLGLHAKLDELIRTNEKARDEIAHIEDLTEQEIMEKRL